MQINKTIVLFSLLLALAPSVSSFGQSRETPVVRAVRNVSPAVVNIGLEYDVRPRENPFSDFQGNPFFDSFFKDFFDHRFKRSQKRTSLGSGVIIDGKRGFILTNAHVISRSGTITVTLNDEREFEAKIVGADPDSDLSVLRITPDERLPTVKMGSSGNLMIGETVIAIGNPFGFSHTVTTGVISATNRSIRTENRVYHDFIQIDASINPGNSGGPLLNINGDLIGINTAIYAKAQGIGFAIPIDTAKKIVSDLIKYGEVVPAWIGVTVQNLNPGLARYLNVGENRGVLVKNTESSGPARKAGIRNGDIIGAIGNQPIASVEDYRSVMKNYAEGNTLAIHFWRSGRKKVLSVKAEIFPMSLAEDLAHRIMGVRVESLTKRDRLGRPGDGGVVITAVRKNTYLGHVGVEPGDIIRQIDEITIKNVEDFKRAVARYHQKRFVVILLFRQDQGYYITVKLS